jgi:hypothetical protein
MLEQHYSHFTVSDNPNKFAGHDKRAKKKREKEQDGNTKLLKQLAKQNNQQSKRIEDLLEQNKALMQKIVDGQ